MICEHKFDEINCGSESQTFLGMGMSVGTLEYFGTFPVPNYNYNYWPVAAPQSLDDALIEVIRQMLRQKNAEKVRESLVRLIGEKAIPKS